MSEVEELEMWRAEVARYRQKETDAREAMMPCALLCFGDPVVEDWRDVRFLTLWDRGYGGGGKRQRIFFGTMRQEPWENDGVRFGSKDYMGLASIEATHSGAKNLRVCRMSDELYESIKELKRSTRFPFRGNSERPEGPRDIMTEDGRMRMAWDMALPRTPNSEKEIRDARRAYSEAHEKWFRECCQRFMET